MVFNLSVTQATICDQSPGMGGRKTSTKPLKRLDCRRIASSSGNGWTQNGDEVAESCLVLTICDQSPDLVGRKTSTKSLKRLDHQPRASRLRKWVDVERGQDEFSYKTKHDSGPSIGTAKCHNPPCLMPSRHRLRKRPKLWGRHGTVRKTVVGNDLVGGVRKSGSRWLQLDCWDEIGGRHEA